MYIVTLLCKKYILYFLRISSALEKFVQKNFEMLGDYIILRLQPNLKYSFLKLV